LKEAKSTQGVGLIYKEDFESVSDMISHYWRILTSIGKRKRMKKLAQIINKHLVIVIISIISGTISAQNIGTVFLNMPENFMPTLTKQQRFELLEYSKVNRNDSVKNRFGNFSSVQIYDSINHH